MRNDAGMLPLHRAFSGKVSLDVIQYLVNAYPDSIKDAAVVWDQRVYIF